VRARDGSGGGEGWRDPAIVGKRRGNTSSFGVIYPWKAGALGLRRTGDPAE